MSSVNKEGQLDVVDFLTDFAAHLLASVERAEDDPTLFDKADALAESMDHFLIDKSPSLAEVQLAFTMVLHKLYSHREAEGNAGDSV